MTKDVKVTVLPPSDSGEGFQDTSFDPDLPGRGSPLGMTEGGTRGTDPIRYYNGKWAQLGPGEQEQKARNANVGLAKSKKKRLKVAADALEGHENKEEILKILRRE
jgi:hypothetical protein